jgi:hypothetical protein
MHLDYRTSKYKGKVYKSYGIAQSYRKGGKVKKKKDQIAVKDMLCCGLT